MSEHNFTEVEFDPFEGKEIEKISITTEPQREIWLSCILGGDDANLAYNESLSLKFEGTFNFAAFNKAVCNLVKRHEALRATVSANGESLFIYNDFPFDLQVEDISQLRETEQNAFLKEFLHKEMNTAFDLQEGPLFRFFIHKLSASTHYFTLFKHHIIGDGWSSGIMMEDLGKMYNAYKKNEEIKLPVAPQISTYAEEQIIFNQSAEHLEVEKYWISQYKDVVPVLDMPTDYPRQMQRTYRSSRYDYPIDKEQVAKLKATGAKAGCSLVNTLLSAFEIFLYHKTGQQDIVVGLPSSGQSATGNFGLVGHCVNLLPLKTKVDPQITFTEYLKKRKTAFFDAFDHQRLTFGELVKKLNIKRDSSRIPLVPVVFNIDMGMDNAVVFEELSYQLISNARECETFEIFLNATGSKGSLILEWSYNTQLFKLESIKRMMDEFEFLLQEVIANPSIKIKDIVLADSDDLRTQLAGWNNTYSFYQKDKPLTALIHDTSLKFPEKTAVVFAGKKLSYKSLDQTSSQLAALLIQQGIKTGDIIGLAMERSPEMVISLLAIMKAGAAYIPLDPEYPQERVEFMLNDSSAEVFLTNSKYKRRFQSNATELIFEELWPKLSGFSKEFPDVKISGNDLAYVLYTSGSTGKPKGVQIEHHSFINFLLSMQKSPGITANDRLLAITTISFDISGLELFLPLINGAELTLVDSDSAKDARIIKDLIEKNEITFMQATPSTWRMMIESGWNGTKGLKILCGGEALSQELAVKLKERCAELWNVYGPTETTVWSTIKRITNPEEPITVGKPIANTQVYILDENLKFLPPGSMGEIYIGGDGVARGYINRPELTSERFIKNADSLNDFSRIYRTGDLGKYLETGEIVCLGRVDQQVKIRGHRIELGEIEYSLSKQPGIRQVVIMAREDKPGDHRLVAYVVPDTGTDSGKNHMWIEESESSDILSFSKEIVSKWKHSLSEMLPPYMVPDEFVGMKKLPLTQNNKIDRKLLPKPETKVSENKANKLPRTETEKFILEIWQNCLEMKDIGIDEDFFEIGGHSLIAVKVMSQIEKQTGKRLPLTSLFSAPTIEKLSLLLVPESKGVVSWNSLMPIKTKGTKPPLYLIHGGGLTLLVFNLLAKTLDDDQPVYGLQPKGLDGIEEPLDKMEDIAAHYIAEILKQNPDGPYAIAGFSFGGLLAFEMGKQLKAMGKEVLMVGMLDSFAQQSDRHKPIISKTFGRILEFFRKVRYTLFLFSKDPVFITKFRFLTLRMNARKLLIRLGLIRKEEEKGDFLVYSKKVADNISLAFHNYTLTPYDGTVDLFRAQTQMFYLPEFKYLGWKPLALKGVNVHHVPGDHGTIFTQPNVNILAKALQNCLNDNMEKRKGQQHKSFLKVV